MHTSQHQLRYLIVKRKKSLHIVAISLADPVGEKPESVGKVVVDYVYDQATFIINHHTHIVHNFVHTSRRALVGPKDSSTND